MPGEPATASLTRYLPSEEPVTIDLGIVKSINDQYTADLTEYSTMIYGCENNFCMDLGVKVRYEVTVERVNPQPYNDSSRDSRQWSNGKWYTELEKLLDFWQNFGLNSAGERTGGLTFAYNSSDTELYPNIITNVFVSGSLNVRTSVQKMTVQIPMYAATMNGLSGGGARQTTLHLVSTSPSLSATRTVPQGVTSYIPSMPPEWEDSKDPNEVLVAWRDSGGTEYDVGDRVIWDEDEVTLYAVWRGAQAVYVRYRSNASEPVIVPAGALRVLVYIVGGGGGGGRHGDETGSTGNRGHYAGGAGAGAQTKSFTVSTLQGTSITFDIGTGGGTGSSGGRTTCYVNGSVSDYAEGGEAGRDATGSEPGAPGEEYFAGGEGTTDQSGRGRDGTAGPGGEGGSGSTSARYYSSTAISRIFYGAGGGGASDFGLNISSPNGSVNIKSRGGNGLQASHDAITEATDGEHGGGGGGGRGSSGGDGVAVVIVF